MWTVEKIKALREKYRETQRQFARRLGVSVGAVRHWEQGKGEPSGPVAILLTRLEEDVRRLIPA